MFVVGIRFAHGTELWFLLVFRGGRIAPVQFGLFYPAKRAFHWMLRADWVLEVKNAACSWVLSLSSDFGGSEKLETRASLLFWSVLVFRRGKTRLIIASSKTTITRRERTNLPAPRIAIITVERVEGSELEVKRQLFGARVVFWAAGGGPTATTTRQQPPRR